MGLVQSTKLGFGEVIITTGICYDKLKEANGNIDPVTIYTNRMPKFDKVKLKDYIFAKFSYNKGDFADKKNSDNLSIFKGGYTNLTQDQNDPYKNLFKDKSSLILWVGPLLE